MCRRNSSHADDGWVQRYPTSLLMSGVAYVGLRQLYSIEICSFFQVCKNESTDTQGGIDAAEAGLCQIPKRIPHPL